MSNRKRRGSQHGRQKPREAEGSFHELLWREHENTGKDHPDLIDILQEYISEKDFAKDGSDLVKDLALIGFSTQNPVVIEATIQLIKMGLGGKDWRKKLRSKVAAKWNPLQDRIIKRAYALATEGMMSKKRAAEIALSELGGGASFEGQVRTIEVIIKRHVDEGTTPFDSDGPSRLWGEEYAKEHLETWGPKTRKSDP